MTAKIADSCSDYYYVSFEHRLGQGKSYFAIHDKFVSIGGKFHHCFREQSLLHELPTIETWWFPSSVSFSTIQEIILS